MDGQNPFRTSWKPCRTDGPLNFYVGESKIIPWFRKGGASCGFRNHAQYVFLRLGRASMSPSRRQCMSSSCETGSGNQSTASRVGIFRKSEMGQIGVPRFRGFKFLFFVLTPMPATAAFVKGYSVAPSPGQRSITSCRFSEKQICFQKVSPGRFGHSKHISVRNTKRNHG